MENTEGRNNTNSIQFLPKSKWRTLSNSLNNGSITLIPKPDKNTGKLQTNLSQKHVYRSSQQYIKK